MPEIMEKEEYHSIIWASRIRARKWLDVVVFKIKHIARKCLGSGLYGIGKKLIGK